MSAPNVAIHLIPVGGDEPIHAASSRCWCQPLVKGGEIITHHAEDLREVAERQGRTQEGKHWALVYEMAEAQT